MERDLFRLTELQNEGVDGDDRLFAGREVAVRRESQRSAKALKEDADNGEEKKNEKEQGTMDIMMLLDIDKVPALRDEFEQKEEGLELAEFVYVMRKYLKRSHLDDAQLVSDLCELFAQIDVNGDGTMEWDEFTSFIVETGNVERMDGPSSIQPYTLTAWQDDCKHSGFVERAYYFSDIGKFGTCETQSNTLNLYHPVSLELERRLTIDEGSILCATYLSGRAEFAMASSNLSISIMDDATQRERLRFDSDTSQTCLDWSPNSKSLYSAGLNGIVHCWDVEDGREKHCMGGVLNTYSHFIMKESHTDMVLDLLQIESLGSIASASMDRTIRLWDVHTGRHKKTLEGHEKGVRSLAYNDEYRFMVSAGFDYDALVWNPYVEHLILRLHGHNAPLCKVEMIPDSPQIITADTSGTFKVWDIRNFGCVQTFAPDTDETLYTFASATPYKMLLATGRRMHQFQYETLKNPDRTNDAPTFCALLNETTLTILTASHQDVRLWDAQKGILLNRFRGLMDGAELTAVCLDDRERKFIVGDHLGRIQVFDYMNGCEMKAFAYPHRAHKSEVSALIYCNEHKIVISSGWDDTIILHDEMDPEEGIMLRTLEGGHHGADISALAFSHKLSLIASGSPCAEASIVLWDFEFGRVEAVLLQDLDSEAQATRQAKGDKKKKMSSKMITALAFIDESFPGLVSADDAGGLVFWAVRPASRWRSQPLARIVNRHENQPAAISVISLHQEKQLVFTADEQGYVRTWDYSSLVTQVEADIGDFKPHECENARRRIHMDVSAKGPLANLRSPRAPVSTVAFHANGSDKRGSTASMATTVFCGSDVVTQLHAWEAHAEGIQFMQLKVEGDYSCVITAASDCLVRVWDLEGNPLGTLRQGETSMAPDWKLQVDIVSRNAQKMGQAENILAEMDDLEEEFAAARAAIEDGDTGDRDDDDLSAQIEDYLTASFSKRRGRRTEDARSSGFDESKLSQDSAPYQRRTPRLAPVGAKMAGRGYSNTIMCKLAVIKAATTMPDYLEKALSKLRHAKTVSSNDSGEDREKGTDDVHVARPGMRRRASWKLSSELERADAYCGSQLHDSFVQACERGDTRFVTECLQGCRDGGLKLLQRNRRALHVACWSANVGVARALLEAAPWLIHERDETQTTPLMEACLGTQNHIKLRPSFAEIMDKARHTEDQAIRSRQAELDGYDSVAAVSDRAQVYAAQVAALCHEKHLAAETQRQQSEKLYTDAAVKNATGKAHAWLKSQHGANELNALAKSVRKDMRGTPNDRETANMSEGQLRDLAKTRAREMLLRRKQNEAKAKALTEFRAKHPPYDSSNFLKP
ncbi:WD repeat-containing protein 5-like [Hondaea fermentalgiana]|uniref:WD repeat-containing protein 5-like n=1 Tax=Hondaea fermentalgiana TaxID=2315210 RepID=A0A2R5G7D2_9STRA|nr:WD repeat-containing protein 5-like [Hondaea fermentalgiana]|eukprot:GBG24373.1 WD repeat-containing protein 5-like [Hondaea fermentalgiana]